MPAFVNIDAELRGWVTNFVEVRAGCRFLGVGLQNVFGPFMSKTCNETPMYRYRTIVRHYVLKGSRDSLPRTRINPTNFAVCARPHW